MDDREYDVIVGFLKRKIVPTGWSSETIQFFREQFYIFNGKLYEIRSKLPVVRRIDLFQIISTAHVSPDGEHLNETDTLNRLLQSHFLSNAVIEVRIYLDGCGHCLNQRIQRQSEMLAEQARHFLDQQKSILEENDLLKKENHRLSQSFDRQLTTNRRVLRLKEKWRLEAKAGKIEISRLQGCSETKDILIEQLKKGNEDKSVSEIDIENRFQSSENESSNEELESLLEAYKIELQSKDDEIRQLKEYFVEKVEILNELAEKAPCVSVENATLKEEMAQTKAKLIAAEAHNSFLMNSMAQLQAKFRTAQKELASEVKRSEDLNIALNDSKEQLSAKQTLLQSREVALTFVSKQLQNAEKKLVDCQCHKQEPIEQPSSETLLLIASLQDKLNVARSELNRLQVEFVSFKNEKDKLEEKVGVQKTKLAKKKSEHKQTVAKLQNEKNEIISQHLAEIKEMEKAIEKETSDHHCAQQLLESKSASLARLEERARKFEEELRVQEKKRSEDRARFNETSAALLKAQEMLKKKCDEAAGVQEMLKKKCDEAAGVQEMLKKKCDEAADAQVIAETNRSQLFAAQEKIKALLAEVSNAQATICKQNEAIEDLSTRTQMLNEALSESKIVCTDEYNRCKQLEAGLVEKESELVKERQLVKHKDTTIVNLERYIAALRKNVNIQQALKSQFLEKDVVMKEIEQERAENVKLRAQLKQMEQFVTYPQSATGSQATFAETLNGFNSIRQEKDAEILRCKHEIATMQAVIRTKEKLIAELHSFQIQQSQRLKHMTHSSNFQAADYYKNTCELEQRICAQMNDIACKELKINELRQTICAFTGDLQKTQDRLRVKEDACKEMEETLKSCQWELSKQMKMVGDLQEKLNTASLSVTKLEQKLLEGHKSNYTLFAKLQSSEKMMGELQQNIGSVTGEAARKEQRIKELEDKAVAREEKVTEMKLQMNALTSKMTSDEKCIYSLQQRLSLMTKEAPLMDQKILKLEKTINSLTNEAVARDGQILELEAKLINEEAQRDKMREKLAVDARDIVDLRAALNTMTEKYEKLQQTSSEGERDIQAFQSIQDVNQSLLKEQHAALKEHKKKLVLVKSKFKVNRIEKKEQAKQIAKLKLSINALRTDLEDRNRKIVDLKCKLGGCKQANWT